MFSITASWLNLLGLGSPSAIVLGYIDPGTSNVLVPAAVGSLGAALLVVKHYWRKLVGLGRSEDENPSPDDPQQPSEEDGPSPSS